MSSSPAWSQHSLETQVYILLSLSIQTYLTVGTCVVPDLPECTTGKSAGKSTPLSHFIFSLAMPASSQQLWVWGTKVKVNKPALVELRSTLPATGADHGSFGLSQEMLFLFFFMWVSYGPLALCLGSCKRRVFGFTHYFHSVFWQVQWKAVLLCSRCGWKWSLHKVLLH